MRYVEMFLKIAPIILLAEWVEPYCATQKELVEMMEIDGFFNDTKYIKDILLQVDRNKYVEMTEDTEFPVDIGYGATFCPLQLSFALASLEDHLKEGARVLDIGSGSGYSTVCLALMVGKTGHVFGVEHIPELVNRSIHSVMADRPFLLEEERITFIEGDGRLGLPKQGPYDVIHVGAKASLMPDVLLAQLKDGGRLVMPVHHFKREAEAMYLELWVVDKKGCICNRFIKSGLEIADSPDPLESKLKQIYRYRTEYKMEQATLAEEDVFVPQPRDDVYNSDLLDSPLVSYPDDAKKMEY